MNKTLMALVLTVAISFSAAMTAFAADTATNISLEGRANFSVTLQTNSLVFSNEPTYDIYDSISLEIISMNGEIVRNITYARGQGNGATLDVAGIPAGSYYVRVGYVTKGFKIYRDKYAYTLEVNSGVASFKPIGYYANNLKITATERTDAYALNFYKGGTYATDAAYIKQANLITAGITDDYAKVKAIHDWVANNMYYDYSDGDTIINDVAAANAEVFPGSGVMKRTICVGFAGVTENLMVAAGFPAKTVGGNTVMGVEGHAWNEVYVDGRWVFLDTTYDSKNLFDGTTGTFSKQVQCAQTYFDTPIAEWSTTHRVDEELNELDTIAWNGSLYIKKVGPTGIFQDKVLQEVKNFPINGLVTSTYGYKATDMYRDALCTIPWNFATDRVFSGYIAIYVKIPTISVTLDSRGGTAVKSMELKPDANGYCKIPTPVSPTRSGYTFTGWVVGSPDNSTVWDFKTWTVTYDETLYATWKKTAAPVAKYTVTYNSNGGTAVKASTVNVATKLVKPATPIRKGYKFVNWYKDSKCTKVWNFSTDKVTAITVLYAKWTR